MAEPALTFLRAKVTEALVKQYTDLISSSQNELNQLQNELNLLEAFLKDAAANKSKIRELESQIRDLVYEVEDIIDTYLTMKNSRRSFFLGIKLAKEVKSIREMKVLPLVAGIKLGFGTILVDNSSRGAHNPRTKLKRDAPVMQKRVVGFEDEEDTITRYLMQENENGLDVIPIIGKPGQGKTTLAWKIYQNESICYHFPIRIWVYISQKFNSRDVFLQILRLFTSHDMSQIVYDELVETVAICLEKEKFLLVLDDVWSVEAWYEIEKALPTYDGKGKVLITSRQMEVGICSNIRKKPHELRFLNEKESWTLLQYEVFGNEEGCPKELRSIGRYIAMKCDGVPLTIAVVGGILVDQLTLVMDETKKEWEAVAENMGRAIEYGHRIKVAIELSYHRLPNELRECFVYMGVFPENYEIPVQMLIGLWIAEGFIQPKDGKSFEQSAEENLMDLIGMNLLKAEKTNHMGKVKTCRVHGMIRCFCVYVARSDEEHLFQEIKKSNATEAFDPSVAENCHRLCIHSHLPEFLSESPKGPRVRSFLCFHKQPVNLAPNYVNVIPDGFPKLRVLESKSITLHQFPAKVTKLIHVRYLTLFIDNPTNPAQQINLPREISRLWNLQTLVVQTQTRTIKMKANLWLMIQLRHLKTTAAIVLDNKSEGEGGQNLQTLDRLSAESCTDGVSKSAKNLKTLGISGKLAKVFETNFLGNLDRLEKLKLVNSSTYEATPDDLLRGLPLPNCFPRSLKSLTLRNTNLKWKHMSTLANVKTLEALKLKDNAFVGLSWVVSDYNFPNLQLLLIVNANLVTWEASNDSLPNLRFLVVKNCENLLYIPACLGAHLEKLEIERLRISAVDSAMAIEKREKENREGKLAVQFKLKMGPMCGTM